jgi:large subunit ribosomal protein L25
METITLKVKSREAKGKKMRNTADKNIPAVVYGPTMEPQMLWVNAVEIAKVFSNAGTNTVLSLVIDDAKPINVLIHDFQLDALTDEFIHIDFYLVDMNAIVETEIPLVFVGESQAVKGLGGTLVKNQDTVTVKALPANLPHEIEVNLETLETFDDHITFDDITVGSDVEIVVGENNIIAMVAAPRTEEEMAALDEEVDADVSKVEGVADKDVEGEEGEEGEENDNDEKKEIEKTEEK